MKYRPAQQPYRFGQGNPFRFILAWGACYAVWYWVGVQLAAILPVTLFVIY